MFVQCICIRSNLELLLARLPSPSGLFLVGERRPLKRFTPPRKLNGSESGESSEYSDSDEYSDSEYSDSDSYT